MRRPCCVFVSAEAEVNFSSLYRVSSHLITGLSGQLNTLLSSGQANVCLFSCLCCNMQQTHTLTRRRMRGISLCLCVLWRKCWFAQKLWACLLGNWFPKCWDNWFVHADKNNDHGQSITKFRRMYIELMPNAENNRWGQMFRSKISYTKRFCVSKWINHLHLHVFI